MARLFADKCTLLSFVYHLLLLILMVNSTQIPYIDSAIFMAPNASSISRSMNGSCSACLCLALSSSDLVVNCFTNNTCQLFSTFPLTYRIVQAPGALLYFLRGFPNASQCCVSNITQLLNQLNAANATYTNVTSPRDAMIDNNGYFVTVEQNTNSLDRLNSTSLTRINRTYVLSATQWAATYLNGFYYIATDTSIMPVVDSGGLALVANITMFPYNARGLILLNNGQIMVLTFFNNNSLVFLNRTSSTPINYTFSFSQKTSFSGPHGIWRVNDSFFYVGSNKNNSVFSYRATGNYKNWTETHVLSVAINTGSGLARVTIDECARFWLTFQTNMSLIYDQQGSYLGNWTVANSQIFDIKIVTNYLMYLTDSSGRIRRVDPKIQCDF